MPLQTEKRNRGQEANWCTQQGNKKYFRDLKAHNVKKVIQLVKFCLKV
jgi:hypothetical protein